MTYINRARIAAATALLVIGLHPGVNASAISDWQDSLQRRAEGLVKAITGANNVYVFAKLDLETLGAVEDNVDKLFRPTGTTGEILPGISKDDIAPHFGRGDVYTSGDRQERTVRIRSVELLVTLPASVSDKRIQILKNRLPAMLGFTAKDRLTIEQISMAGTWERSLQRLGEVLPLLLIGFLLALGIVSLVAMGPLKTVIREIRRARPASDDAPSGPGFRPAPANAAPPVIRMEGLPVAAPTAGGSSAGVVEQKAPFAFITEENLPKVIHLLSMEPAELIAFAVSSLTPAMSVTILHSLTPEKKKSVMKELTALRVHEPEAIRAMAQRLAERVSCISGGVERLGELFWEMDQAAQDSWLKLLEKTDPATAGEIRRRLITVDDIFAADPALLRQVLWESYQQGQLSLFLKTRSADVQKKALAALPASLQRVVEEDVASLLKAPADAEKESLAEKSFLTLARRIMGSALQKSAKKGPLS